MHFLTMAPSEVPGIVATYSAPAPAEEKEAVHDDGIEHVPPEEGEIQTLQIQYPRARSQSFWHRLRVRFVLCCY